MDRITLDELFFDFLDAVKSHVPESDHTVMCIDILRSLDDSGYELTNLHGHDVVVDEALEELFPEIYDDGDVGDY